jgi:hypothetical protein
MKNKNCINCNRELSLYGHKLKRYDKNGDLIEKRYSMHGLCGMCYKRKLNNNTYKHIKDNKTKSRFYKIWMGMRTRCYNLKCKDYKNYGLKNVYICEEWLNRDTGFRNFENWCLNNNFQEGLTIDRIDVKGIYEPSNCRFITTEEQNKNQRPKSNIGLDYIFDIRNYKHKESSKFRIYVGNHRSRYAMTLERALEIRKEIYGF